MNKKLVMATKKALPLSRLRPQANLYDAIRERIAPLGGVDLPEIPREPMREPPDFGRRVRQEKEALKAATRKTAVLCVRS